VSRTSPLDVDSEPSVLDEDHQASLPLPTESERLDDRVKDAKTVFRHAAFVWGARGGVRITLMPSQRNTSSKLAANFEWRSWIRNLTSPSAFERLGLRAC